MESGKSTVCVGFIPNSSLPTQHSGHCSTHWIPKPWQFNIIGNSSTLCFLSSEKQNQAVKNCYLQPATKVIFQAFLQCCPSGTQGRMGDRPFLIKWHETINWLFLPSRQSHFIGKSVWETHPEDQSQKLFFLVSKVSRISENKADRTREDPRNSWRS